MRAPPKHEPAVAWAKTLEACWLGAWLVMAVIAPAAAQDVDVTWSAPPECPQQSAVQQRVQTMLATSQAAGRPLRARGMVQERAAGRYHLSLEVEVDGQRATRELDASQCTSLSDTGAWLIAVALDPNVPPPAPPPDAAEPATRPNGQAPAAAPETETKAQPRPAQEAAQPAAEAPQTERERLARWWRVGTYGGMWSAGLPGPAGQLGVRAGLGFGWLYAELRADHVFARSRELVSTAGTATFTSQELTAAACGEWGGQVRAGPCLTIAGVRTVGETEGVTTPGSDAVFWALGGASAGMSVRVWGLLELSLDAGAGWPLSPRPRFGVQNYGIVGEAAFLTGYARLGLSVRGP